MAERLTTNKIFIDEYSFPPFFRKQLYLSIEFMRHVILIYHMPVIDLILKLNVFFTCL
jgi:hypothetical protein